MTRFLIAAVLVHLTIAHMGRADDLYPPPWDRYTPESTYSEWTFDAPSPYPEIYPEHVWDPFDLSMIEIYNWAEWANFYEGHQGVMRIEGDSRLDIVKRNDFASWPTTELYLQMTVPHTSNIVEISSYCVIDEDYVPFDLVLETEQLLDGGTWWYLRYHAIIEPSPSFMTISLEHVWGGEYELYVDQIVLDTFNSPEPATVVLLLVGGASALRRSRRAGL